MRALMQLPALAAIGVMTSVALPSQAATPCELRSPPHRLGLLELYTSEGCSSCPPADRWLSRLRPAYSDQQVVPLAFHVDYWNQLGWPDRYSHRRYTQRQQQASGRNRAEFIYTPQFLLDGKDVRPARSGDGLTPYLAPINKEPSRANIVAQASLGPSREIEVRGTAALAHGSGTAETYIAIYENGIISKVAAGENGGKTLQHDFVVRALVGPIAFNPQGVATLEHKITLPADARVNALGVAIFTQDRVSGTVLQVAATERCLVP